MLEIIVKTHRIAIIFLTYQLFSPAQRGSAAMMAVTARRAMMATARIFFIILMCLSCIVRYSVFCCELSCFCLQLIKFND